jgi:hypothetical protein
MPRSEVLWERRLNKCTGLQKIMARVLLHLVITSLNNNMTRSFYLTALASILVLSSYAQHVCCSQPTIIQVHTDETHTVLINVLNTSTYINTKNGTVDLLPCNTVITHDFTSGTGNQPDRRLVKPGQRLSRRPVRPGHKVSMTSPNSNFKGIGLTNTRVKTYQSFRKTN